MDNLNTLDQIGQQSNKVLFQYNLVQNRFDFLTQAFCEIWELDQQQLLEHPDLLFDTIHDEDHSAVTRCWQKLLDGEPVDMTIRLKRIGRQRFVRFVVYPIHGAPHEVVAVAGMAENVTRQQEFIDYLSEFGQRKDSALEMVLHDLHGPLAIVKSVAALLRQDMQDNRHEEVAHYTRIIENACLQCTDLIRDLLSEEHLMSPEISVNKMRANLSEIIRDTTDFYKKGQIVQQKLLLDLPQEPLIVELDRIKFTQILNNLISNSIKFTPSTGSITICAFQEGDEVVIEHSDTGIGIPEKLQEKLFDRKSNVGRKGLNGEESRGIGLSIVYELVRLQGGSIQVHSRENEGTRIMVRLPIQES